MLGVVRGLSSRPTEDVVRDLEIGQPSNSEKCSETADGVTCESEGGSRLSLLRSVRQDQPRRHSGACLCPVPLEQGRAGYRRPGFCGHRGVWGRAMAGGTGACPQAGDLSARANQGRYYTLQTQPQSLDFSRTREVRLCPTASSIDPTSTMRPPPSRSWKASSGRTVLFARTAAVLSGSIL